MLRKISISNYALIDELQLEFGPGLTIITGETGAGKSILLGALQLLLGQRADTGVLRDPAKKCIVEGTFITDAFDLSSFFEEHDLDHDKVCIVRREFNAAGKSRAFINDTPVNLTQIRELSAKLIDIHSQHDHLQLESSVFQTALLDAFAGNHELYQSYRKTYLNWKDASRALELLREAEARNAAEFDYLQFQYQELDAAALIPDESEKLEEEFRRLDHATEIIKQTSRAEAMLDSDEHNILGAIRQLIQLLSPVARYTKQGEDISSRLQTVQVEMRDILDELAQFREKSGADPQNLEQISARLDRINHLLGKHRVKNSNELISIREQLRQKLNQHTEQGSQIIARETETEALRQAVYKLSASLSSARTSAIPALVKQGEQLLARLGMPSAVLKVILQQLDQPGQYGADQVNFLFSANQGASPREIQKVASGGELSRLMLALKKMIARSVALPTIIFDEIDTGISGALADAMGDLLKEMSADMQVLAITHLPQIASKADEHLKVIKATKSKITTTQVVRLNRNERIEEIAAMLSGKELSGEAISNAETLLGLRKK